MLSCCKTKIVAVALGLLSGLILLCCLYATNTYAQSPNPQAMSGYKIYENQDYHVSIQYPKSWKKSESGLGANVIVSFTAPDAKGITEPAGLSLGYYQISNDTTMDEFVDFFLKNRYEKPTNYKIINSSDSTLLGMPSREMVIYEYNNPSISLLSSSLKTLRIVSMDNNGNAYFIKYWAEPGLFNKYLPTAKKMINTFSLTGEKERSKISDFALENKNTTSVSTPNQSPQLVTKFIMKFGSPGTGDGQFHDPGDLAIDSSNGFVYVADLLNNRIQKFDTNGKYLSQWGSYGSGDGQFSHPGDVAISPWGEIFVADIDNARIQKFTPNATFISKWGVFGTEDSQFNHPGDIAFESINNTIFVADIDNNRIQKFDSNGTFLSKWGSLGIENGQFNQPAGIAFDDINKILYVADTKNDRIQKFTPEGAFLSKWGTTGSGVGELKRPTSIAVDPLNKVVYVADTNNQRIQKFDLSGNFISTWGSQGVADGQFNRPSGIAFDSPNTVYVSDKENNIIQVFTSTSSIPSVGTLQTTGSESPISSSSVEPLQTPGSPDLAKIPDTITVSASSEDNDLPIVGTIDRNGGVNTINDQVDIQDLKFEVDDWNPKLTFQFIEGSDTGLVNVKQVIIGKIKAYPTSQIAMTSGLLWKNIPLNQEVVLKIREKGLNYIIVQVQFTNGVTAIYSGAMDVKPTINDRSYYNNNLKDDLKANKGLKVIASSLPKLKQDPIFFQVTQNVVCDDLSAFGFRSCE